MRTFTRPCFSQAELERKALELKKAGVPSSNIVIQTRASLSRQIAEADKLSAFATGAAIGSLVGAIIGLLSNLVMALPVWIGPSWLANTAIGTVVGSAIGGVIGQGLHTQLSASNAHGNWAPGPIALITVQTSLAEDRVQAILDSNRPFDPGLRFIRGLSPRA